MLLLGYEIYVGVICGEVLVWLVVVFDDGCVDGVCSVDGNVMGIYLYGLFEFIVVCLVLLCWVGLCEV